jgi:hypothetical protein
MMAEGREPPAFGRIIQVSVAQSVVARILGGHSE